MEEESPQDGQEGSQPAQGPSVDGFLAFTILPFWIARWWPRNNCIIFAWSKEPSREPFLKILNLAPCTNFLRPMYPVEKCHLGSQQQHLKRQKSKPPGDLTPDQLGVMGVVVATHGNKEETK